MPADRVVGVVPEYLLGTSIEVHDALGLIDRDDRVRRDGEDAGELCFGGLELLMSGRRRRSPWVLLSDRSIALLPARVELLREQSGKYGDNYQCRDRQNQTSERIPSLSASCT